MTGIPQVDIAFWVNTIQFGHRQLKRLVLSTVINNVGLYKYLVDKFNIACITVTVIVALRYYPLGSNPHAGDLCGGFWERLFKKICLVLEPLRPPLILPPIVEPLS